MSMRVERFVLVAVTLMLIFGCTTPSGGISGSVKINPNQIDNHPFGSHEIIECAKSIAPSLLMALDTESGGPVYISIQTLKNSSSVLLNSSIITNELKTELAKIALSQGTKAVRFITGDSRVLNRGNAVVRERLEAKRERVLEEVADALLNSPIIKNASKTPVIAIVPAVNSNMVNLNANSFVSMLRGKIASKAAGKVHFTMPGSLEGADYYLTGEFIAESMKNEGMINLVDYIHLFEKRLAEGKPLDVITDSTVVTTESQDNGVKYDARSTAITREREHTLLSKIARRQDMRSQPNVNKHLNIMLIKADTKVSVFENMFTLDRKTNNRLAQVNYILHGEFTSISRRIDGEEGIYILGTFHLIEPETGEEIWTDSYRSKKNIKMGEVYN